MVSAGTPSDLLRWIPLLPLAAAIYHGVVLVLVRRQTPRFLTIAFSCGSVLASFIAACVAFWTLRGLAVESRILVDNVYTWFGAGVGDTAFSAELSFSLDPISAFMTLIVTGVGLLIHIYSIGYMDDDHRDDKGFQRFFCYLNLFTFSMLVLVLADNLVLMFLGWEGVGLCSYLLIGFWYSDRYNAYCGSKAFIVNRIGDFAFLIAIFLIFQALAQAGTPSVAFIDIAENIDSIAAATLAVPAWVPFGPEWSLPNTIALCLFVGACGKSAQLPLYVWLPDAMAGPTPVSALIHAATMVTAGVYMVCRFSFLFAVAPEASAVVAWVGGLTAIFAATIAVAQTDSRRSSRARSKWREASRIDPTLTRAPRPASACSDASGRRASFTTSRDARRRRKGRTSRTSTRPAPTRVRRSSSASSTPCWRTWGPPARPSSCSTRWRTPTSTASRS